MRKEKELLVQLLNKAAVEIESRFRKEMRFDLKDELGRDAVTEADLLSEEILIHGIKNAFPEDRIISEERGILEKGGSKRLWLLDPLDGTNNFRQGIPYFCVTGSLWMHGEPVVAGTIAAWDRMELFLAIKGRGATLNGKTIKVTHVSEIPDAYVSIDSGISISQRSRAASLFSVLAPRVRGVRLLGSAALAQAYVACGRLDAYVNPAGLEPWDTGAGKLLVQEAGGSFSRLDGRDVGVDSGNLAACSKELHKELLTLAQEVVD